MHGIQRGQRLAERAARAELASVRISYSGVRTLTSKRVMDVLIALIALVMLAPVLLLIGVAVKLSSPGPALFRQRRYGQGRRLFTIYKFRTMRVSQENGVTIQSMQQDARLTPIGAFLRRTSLDELPQFWNVLRGEMSVVGPRPHAPLTMIGEKCFEEIVHEYDARHWIKPGITGFAQVSGFRGPIPNVASAKGRFACDVEYVYLQSLRLDCWILWRTLVAEFLRGTGY
jgi:lipopolysaccharide/colanic/teichoic acid biosynthesis glycosyltransferase